MFFLCVCCFSLPSIVRTIRPLPFLLHPSPSSSPLKIHIGTIDERPVPNLAVHSNVIMNFAKAALPLALASTARAFSPAARVALAPAATTARAFAVGPSSRRGISSTTALGANVLKLTQPAKDLLPDVDVFIFDCDGVIWRVSGSALAWSDIFAEKPRNCITCAKKKGSPLPW